MRQKQLSWKMQSLTLPSKDKSTLCLLMSFKEKLITLSTKHKKYKRKLKHNRRLSELNTTIHLPISSMMIASIRNSRSFNKKKIPKTLAMSSAEENKRCLAKEIHKIITSSKYRWVHSQPRSMLCSLTDHRIQEGRLTTKKTL